MADEALSGEDKASDELKAMRAELAEMRTALQMERTGRQTAETGKAHAERRVLSEAEQRLLAQEQAADASIAGMESEAEALEGQIGVLADEPGHGKEIAALNRKLSTISAKIETASNQKTYLAAQRERAKKQAETPAADASPKLADGRSLSGFSPKVQTWFHEHPRVFSDQIYLKKAIAAAISATDIDGLAAESPEYFARVEEVMGERQATLRATEGDRPSADQPYSRTTQSDGEELGHEVKNPQSRAAGPGAIAAPVSRVAATSANSPNRRAPSLTAEEREVADVLLSHVPVKDRYTRYADDREFMKQRRGNGAFGAN